MSFKKISFINIIELSILIISFIFIFIGCLTSCTSDEETTDTYSDIEVRGTEVYVQSNRLTSRQKYASIQDNLDCEYAYFFIRIDGNIPGFESQNSKYYFPGNIDGTTFFGDTDSNKGIINNSYNYRTDSSDKNLTKYCYDPTGETVQSKTIISAPSIKNLIDANKNTSFDLTNIDTTNLKIIWYVTKYDWGAWHVDGVLTYKSTKDVTDVFPDIEQEYENKGCTKEEPIIPFYSDSANIEVDVHQQKHADWDEIKTSIHIREFVDKVTVEIPIGSQNFAEADDFAIRQYDYFYTLPNRQEIKYLSVKVSHEMERIVIEVALTEDIKEHLAELKRKSNDGITIEVHSYPKDISRKDVWNKLKDIKTYTNPQLAIKFLGATSAFFTR